MYLYVALVACNQDRKIWENKHLHNTKLLSLIDVDVPLMYDATLFQAEDLHEALSCNKEPGVSPDGQAEGSVFEFIADLSGAFTLVVFQNMKLIVIPTTVEMLHIPRDSHHSERIFIRHLIFRFDRAFNLRKQAKEQSVICIV